MRLIAFRDKGDAGNVKNGNKKIMFVRIGHCIGQAVPYFRISQYTTVNGFSNDI